MAELMVEEEEEDAEKREEEISACQHFMVDKEIENGRQEVFNFLTSKHPSSLRKQSRRNLNKSSTSSTLPKKSTLLWGLFFEK